MFNTNMVIKECLAEKTKILITVFFPKNNHFHKFAYKKTLHFFTIYSRKTLIYQAFSFNIDKVLIEKEGVVRPIP